MKVQRRGPHNGQDGKKNAPGAATPEASNDRTCEDQITPMVGTPAADGKSGEIHVLSLALLVEVLRHDPSETVSLSFLAELGALDGLDGALADAVRDVPRREVVGVLITALEDVKLAADAPLAAHGFVGANGVARGFLTSLVVDGADVALETFEDRPDAGPLALWLATLGELWEGEHYAPDMPPHVRAGCVLGELAEGLRLSRAELEAYVGRVARMAAANRFGFSPLRAAG